MGTIIEFTEKENAACANLTLLTDMVHTGEVRSVLKILKYLGEKDADEWQRIFDEAEAEHAAGHLDTETYYSENSAIIHLCLMGIADLKRTKEPA